MQPPLWFGPYGTGAIEYLAFFAEGGANAAWFHMFNAQALEACARRGIAACVEFKTFRADFNEHPELIPTGADGKPIRYGDLVQGICLSQADYLEKIEADLVQGLQQYRPDGIWLDYLTYTGWFEMPNPDLQESCFCPACILEFCQATHMDAESPAEILAHHAAAWTQHKCERVAGFARRYASLIRAAHPSCMVGAYMCPWTPEEHEGALRRIFAQDYALLAESIDVFTPLIYAKKSGYSPGWGRDWLEHSTQFTPSTHKVQLILDALDFPASLTETAQSSIPSWGLQMFGGEKVFREAGSRRVFAEAVEKIRLKLG